MTGEHVVRALAVVGAIALLVLASWAWTSWQRHQASSYCQQSGRTYGPADYSECLDWYAEGSQGAY